MNPFGLILVAIGVILVIWGYRSMHSSGSNNNNSTQPLGGTPKTPGTVTPPDGLATGVGNPGPPPTTTTSKSKSPSPTNPLTWPSWLKDAFGDGIPGLPGGGSALGVL